MLAAAAVAEVAKANEVLTRDLGGAGTTEDVTKAIIDALERDDLDLEGFNRIGS